MNIGAIDIGTNTIRLLIGQIDNGRLARIASDRAVTRLGKDLMKTGVLSADSINKSLSALKSFKETCDKYNVTKIIAVGTSALREAKNSRDFINAVKKETGIEIEIISGEREAELTAKGVTTAIGDKKGPGKFFIIDIGGGSTEWIIYKGSNQLPALSDQGKNENTEFNSSLITHNPSLILGSLPVGAVKLLETYIKHDPPAAAELDECAKFIHSKISGPLDSSLNNSSLILIATGGTPTTLAAIDLGLEKYDGEKINMHIIPRSSLIGIFDKLVSLPHEARTKIKGLEPDRSDIIIPGLLILITIMDYLKINEMVISDYGLLEGLLTEIQGQT